MRLPRSVLLTSSLLAACCAACPPAAAQTLHTVTDCGDTTPGGAPGQLRRLMNDAAPGDTIAVPACIITLTGGPGDDLNAGGDLDVTKNLSIVGAGSRRTIIDGGALDRVFDVQSAVTAAISGLMIRNGLVVVPPGGGGGGIRNRGTLTLAGVVVSGNVAYQTETQGAFGAGIANEGTLTLSRSTVAANSISGYDSGRGVGIDNLGTMTIEASTVSGNLLLVFYGGEGAGISNAGMLTIRNSTVSGNLGFGGIVNSGTLTVTASTIAHNTRVDLVLVPTFGIGNVGTGSATIGNTLLDDNRPNCAGPMTSAGGNLDSDGSCMVSAAGDARFVDPRIGPLADHGGPTQTHALLPGSAAIGTGLAVACPPADQRGVPRPQAPGCDKGAFEFTSAVFADVPAEHVARGAIEALRSAGVSAGCGTAPPVFCPDTLLTRGQMAVLLLRAASGPAFVPPAATGVFADVPLDHPFASWIEELRRRGVTDGCALAPLRFCPDAAVVRREVPVFLLRLLALPAFPGFVAPPVTYVSFSDVTLTDPLAPWIEEFFRRGLTAGCAASPGVFPRFCPGDPVSRAQAARFLTRAFALGP